MQSLTEKNRKMKVLLKRVFMFVINYKFSAAFHQQADQNPNKNISYSISNHFMYNEPK